MRTPAPMACAWDTRSDAPASPPLNRADRSDADRTRRRLSKAAAGVVMSPSGAPGMTDRPAPAKAIRTADLPVWRLACAATKRHSPSRADAAASWTAARCATRRRDRAPGPVEAPKAAAPSWRRRDPSRARRHIYFRPRSKPIALERQACSPIAALGARRPREARGSPTGHLRVIGPRASQVPWPSPWRLSGS